MGTNREEVGLAVGEQRTDRDQGPAQETRSAVQPTAFPESDPASTPATSLIEGYRAMRSAWLAEAERLAQMRDLVCSAADRETLEIIAKARQDVRDRIAMARRELMTLTAQLNASLGEGEPVPRAVELLQGGSPALDSASAMTPNGSPSTAQIGPREENDPIALTDADAAELLDQLAGEFAASPTHRVSRATSALRSLAIETSAVRSTGSGSLTARGSSDAGPARMQGDQQTR